MTLSWASACFPTKRQRLYGNHASNITRSSAWNVPLGRPDSFHSDWAPASRIRVAPRCRPSRRVAFVPKWKRSSSDRPANASPPRWHRLRHRRATAEAPRTPAAAPTMKSRRFCATASTSHIVPIRTVIALRMLRIRCPERPGSSRAMSKLT